MENEEKVTTEVKLNEEKSRPAGEVPVSPTPAEQKSGWMPRKTLILILLLIVITAGLLAVALLPITKSPLVTVNPTPTPSMAYAQTVLSLSTPVATTLNNYSTDVLISTGDNKSTAVQLELSYDPKILTNVAIVPGAFFTTPVVLLKKIDTVNGKISYALGINPSQKPINGQGTVATITFSTVAGTTALQTPINFELKTAAAAVGNAPSVLKQASGIIFTLPVTPTPAQ